MKLFFLSFILLLLGIPEISNILGCYGVVFMVISIGVIIFLQLKFFKSKIEEVFCSVYFKDNSIFKKICLHKWLFLVFIAFPFSFVLSFSLVTFMHLANLYILIFVFFDGIFIYFIYQLLFKSSKKHLKDNVATLFSEIGVNTLNIILFVIVVVLIDYYTRPNIQPDLSEILNVVHDNVYHSCKLFKWILRTKAIFIYAIDSIPNIQELGVYAKWLYITLLVTSVSFFPAVALSLYYKWFLLKAKSFEEQKNEKG